MRLLFTRKATSRLTSVDVERIVSSPSFRIKVYHEYIVPQFHKLSRQVRDLLLQGPPALQDLEHGMREYIDDLGLITKDNADRIIELILDGLSWKLNQASRKL